MRLALLSHSPALGGTTDLLIQVRDFFRGRGHEVQVIFGTEATPRDPRVRDALVLSSSGGSWREKMQVYVRLVESFQPDVAYAICGYNETDLFRFLRCARVRHFSTLERHAFADIPFWMRKYRSYFEAGTANTPDALEEVEHYSGRPTFLLPYRMPLMDSLLAQVQLPAQADASRPVEVAFVSRLERFQKRAHWLPEIVRHCQRMGLSLQWHLYGDGPEGPAIREKLQGVPEVIFHGWTDRATLYRELPRHDLLFFCSRWEGLPIAMVEAMSCGLACVAPNIPVGIRWTLGHGGGWLYEASSPRAAAHALARAVANRDLLLEKRREALRLATELFPPSLAEEQYLQLEASFQALVFNGQVLDPATAPKFQEVPLAGYLRRIPFVVEKTLHSPGWLWKVGIGGGFTSKG